MGGSSPLLLARWSAFGGRGLVCFGILWNSVFWLDFGWVELGVVASALVSLCGPRAERIGGGRLVDCNC